MFILVRDEDAEEIAKLNNFQFAGSNLGIAENAGGWPRNNSDGKNGEEGLSQETLERKVQLQEVLSQRYDTASKLLNLSALGKDPILIQMGYLQDKERAEKTFKVLMAICDETFPTDEAKRDAVQSVSVANNVVDWVGPIFTLAETFPGLKHLDLGGNQFKQLKSLSRWRNRFRDLETLVLAGNPLEVEDPNYKTELLEWFPKLLNLNGIQVRTPEQVAAESAARAEQRHVYLPQHGADFRDVSGIAEGFLIQFLPLYDSDRAQLASAFYDDGSQFSLSVTTHNHTDSHVLPWAAYIKYSRNLTKINNIGARAQRLIQGGTMIRELWNKLPKTKHPDFKTDIHKYLVDCHPIPGLPDPTGQSPNGVDGLIISMHGEFEETDQTSGKTGQRSFTRTFVLGPGLPGKAPIRVVSDILSLRAHNVLPEQGPPAAAPVAVAAVAMPDSETEQKKQMVMELSKQTNMTLQYSELCLAEAGWSFETALARFNEMRVG